MSAGREIPDRTKYPLSHMRSVPPDVPRDVVERALAAIRGAFGHMWLDMKTAIVHPVRVLWRRNDWVATLELLLLGSSIETLASISPNWLRDAVGKAKAGDRSRVGFLFEIAALGAFAHGGMTIVPAPPGTPVYDVSVKLSDGSTGRVSVKHFGMSAYERDFLATARRTTEQAKSAAMAAGVRWMGVTVIAERYPERADWSDLASLLEPANL
jgi:hypothetical protein